MAESSAAQRATYPIPSYNFRVSVGSESVSFTEASGLTMEYETLTYRHGQAGWRVRKLSASPPESTFRSR